MNILICDSRPESVGHHVLRLQTVFASCTFDYAQTQANASKKIRTNGLSYDLILSDGRLPDGQGIDIYNDARKQGMNMPFALYGEEGGPDNRQVEQLQAHDEDLFHLGRLYDVSDLKKMMDALATRATA